MAPAKDGNRDVSASAGAIPQPGTPVTPAELLARQRAAQLAADAELAASLTNGSGRAWRRIRADLDKLTAEINTAKAAGQTVDPGWLYRQQRLQALDKRVRAAVGVYVDLARRRIDRASVTALRLGQTDAGKLLAATLPPGLPLPPPLPLPELTAVVASMRPGLPLGMLLDRLGVEAADRARDTLIEGVALGRGTREIGRNLRDSFAGDGVRSLVVARTEVIRAYRDSALTRYRQSQVTAGWIWVAQLGPRTCPICVALHGTIHRVEEPFQSHPSCRCSPAPLTKSWAELGFPNLEETRLDVRPGAEWFAEQSAGLQRRILGPGKLAAFQDERFELEDLVVPTVHPVWGGGLRERPLREIAA